MHAIQVSTDSQISMIQIEEPKVSDDEILIKTIGCGVCGTDLLKINLKLLNKSTVLGHEIVGEVTKVGSNVQGYAIGDLIVVAHHVPCFDCHYCAHENYSMCQKFKSTNLDPGGFAEYVRLSADHIKHTTFKIPKDMDWQEAIYTEPLACCVRNIDRLPLLKGDTVIIVGLGSIGLMMTKLLKRFPCHVVGLDLEADRREQALSFGVDEAYEKLPEDLIQKLTNNQGADGVIFTAGPASMLNGSLKWIRNGGFVNLFAHLAGEMANVDTAELYHRELQLVTTYSPSPQALKKSFQILKTENLGLKAMFSNYKPDQFEMAIDDVNQKRVLKALIEFK